MYATAAALMTSKSSDNKATRKNKKPNSVYYTIMARHHTSIMASPQRAISAGFPSFQRLPMELQSMMIEEWLEDEPIFISTTGKSNHPIFDSKLRDMLSCDAISTRTFAIPDQVLQAKWFFSSHPLEKIPLLSHYIRKITEQRRKDFVTRFKPLESSAQKLRICKSITLHNHEEDALDRDNIPEWKVTIDHAATCRNAFRISKKEIIPVCPYATPRCQCMNCVPVWQNFLEYTQILSAGSCLIRFSCVVFGPMLICMKLFEGMIWKHRRFCTSMVLIMTAPLCISALVALAIGINLAQKTGARWYGGETVAGVLMGVNTLLLIGLEMVMKYNVTPVQSENRNIFRDFEAAGLRRRLQASTRSDEQRWKKVQRIQAWLEAVK